MLSIQGNHAIWEELIGLIKNTDYITGNMANTGTQV